MRVTRDKGVRPIKEILFQLLDEIEPYELLYLFNNKSYCPRVVCSNKSLLPIATEIRKASTFPEEDELAYLREFTSEEEQNNIINYKNDNTVLINNEKYLITEKILYIKYYDSYYEIVVQDQESTYTVYETYDSIQNIKRVNISNGKLLDYNKMIYEININK
jgi:hypothetical protein